MSNKFVLFGGIGALIGLLIATLTRPELPIFGKPGIGIAFQSFFESNDSMAEMYASQFGPHLILWVIIGLIIGLVAAKFLGKSSQKIDEA